MVLIGVIAGFAAANIMGMSGFAFGAPQNDAQPTPTNVPTAPPPAAEATGEVDPIDPSSDYIRGNPDADIALIEWSDLECPFCARVHPTYSQLLEEYGDDIMWVYRHFPLNSIHPNAQKAAEASECAGEQGGNDAFWQFIDLVFEQGAQRAQYAGYAETIGIDAEEFESCIDSGKYAAKVSAQLQSGTKAGVRGTPGNIVLNVTTGESRSIPGAQPIDSFKAAIDSLQ